MFRVPVERSLRQGWWFVNSHQNRFLRMAVVPALFWLALKTLPPHYEAWISSVIPMAPDQLAGMAVILFGALWFRFAVSRARSRFPAPTGTRISPRIVFRIVARSAMIVLGVTALLTVPAVAFAFVWVLIDQPLAMTPQYASHIATLSFPAALFLMSPVLVRLYAYYGAVIAGRHDVTPLDAWRWARGKSMALVAMALGGLAPALVVLWLVEVLGLGVLGYAPAAVILFISVALMTGAMARAMMDLVAPPTVGKA